MVESMFFAISLVVFEVQLTTPLGLVRTCHSSLRDSRDSPTNDRNIVGREPDVTCWRLRGWGSAEVLHVGLLLL